MSTVQKQFNRAARQYDNHSVVQNTMARELLLFVPKEAYMDSSMYSSILDVGCGTGILTKAIYDTFPNARITAIDMSEKMLYLAQKKLPHPNISFTLQDVESAKDTSTDDYDLIFSNAVFQWFKEPQHTLSSLTNRLNKNGHLLAATFGPETFCELTSLFIEVEKDLNIASQTHHLPMKTAQEWSHILANASLHDIEIRENKEKVYYPNCRQFLHAVKGVGANYSQSCHPLTVQKKVLQEVMHRYDERYGFNGSSYATYHILYLKGKKRS